MAEVTKEIVSPIFQKTGEDLYKINPETVASVVYTMDGGSVEEKIEELKDALDDLGGGGTSKPWSAYGEGIAGAPDELRDGGMYVADGEAAPESPVEAVLCQKREETVEPIYPRTDAALVSLEADGVEGATVAAAIAEVAEKADLAQETAEQASEAAAEAASDISDLSSTVTTVQADVSNLQTAVQNIETQVESVECTMVTASLDLSFDVESGGEIETPGIGYKPGNSTLTVWYEGLRCRLGEQYEETEANSGGYATSIKLLFDAEGGATFDFSALNGVTR